MRTAVQLLIADIQAPKHEHTNLKGILAKKGGYYKTVTNRESVMFPVYTNFAFTPHTLDRRGVSCGVSFDAPPFQGARSKRAAERYTYWQSAGKKRLMQGSLVTLVWSVSPSDTKSYIGIVTSSAEELATSARSAEEPMRLAIKISFIDPEAEGRILDDLKHRAGGRNPNETRILTECPIMYESIRPFLQALRVTPSLVPFERYLAHPDSGTLKDVKIEAPLYSTLPGVELELASLFRSDSGVQSWKLNTTDQESIAAARAALNSPYRLDQTLPSSVLDPSQVDAVLGALTSEVSLTQGFVRFL